MVVLLLAGPLLLAAQADATSRPVVSAITPIQGPQKGGTWVTITGKYFVGKPTVTFGKVRARTVQVRNSMRLRVLAPAQPSSGFFLVHVKTANGTSMAARSYLAYARPVITALEPAVGLASSATTVTIHGIHLSGVLKARVGPVETTRVSPRSDSTVLLTVPKSAVGAAPISLFNPGGWSPPAAAAAFRYLDPPATMTASAAVGPSTGGATVDLIGPGAEDVTTVRFGGTAATTLTHPSATVVRVTTPAHPAGDVYIDVLNPVGHRSSLPYRFVDAPTVTGISPTVGATSGAAHPGDEVVIHGAHLSAVTSVLFGDTPADPYAPSDDTLVVHAPAHPEGTVDVVIVSAGGQATLPQAYRYYAKPVVATLSASTGPAVGGLVVTIGGEHLDGVRRVLIGDTPATDVRVVSDTELRVTTPARPSGSTGDVQVTTPGGTSDPGDASGYVSTRTAPDGPWVQVSTGSDSSCAVRADASAWCWGRADYGALGDGTRAAATGPVPVAGGSSWAIVAAAGFHTCGVHTDNTLWCWGYNSRGALGNGTSGGVVAQPQQVGLDADWSSVSAGASSTCGLRTDGSMWCWGRIGNGQTGSGYADQLVPRRVDDDTTWAQVSVEDDVACGRRTDGSVWCWRPGEAAPTPVAGNDWVAVSAGDTTCAVKADASAWCWGQNAFGEVGDDTKAYRATPTLVAGDHRWAAVSSAQSTTCGVDRTGAAWCWGWNGHGQVGDGTTTDRWVPTQVGTSDHWLSVEPATASCGRTDDGHAWCWGTGTADQRGDGRTDDSSVPTLVTESR